MRQLRITRHRAASARRRGEAEQPLPLDPRDPDITRAKQLQCRPRQPSAVVLASTQAGPRRAAIFRYRLAGTPARPPERAAFCCASWRQQRRWPYRNSADAPERGWPASPRRPREDPYLPGRR